MPSDSNTKSENRIDIERLRGLLAKRKTWRFPGGREISWLPLSREESEEIYEVAREHGLLLRYEFSGISSDGVSRHDAARRMLERTREKAFQLLRREFGASARFQAAHGSDFYWKKARIRLVITGPLIDDRSRGDPRRTRDDWGLRLLRESQRETGSPETGTKEYEVPYYRVWHKPSEFVADVRRLLAGSRCYPRLADKR